MLGEWLSCEVKCPDARGWKWIGGRVWPSRNTATLVCDVGASQFLVSRPIFDLGRHELDRPIVHEPVSAQYTSRDLSHDAVEVYAVADVASPAGRLGVCDPSCGGCEALQT